MNIPTVRTSTAILAAIALLTLFLVGCAGSSEKGAPQETDAQKSKREAIIQQHKDAADNVH